MVCLLLVCLILLQRGKDSGSGLFGGGSTAVLTSQGTATFLVKFTSILSVLFFLLSVSLGYLINRQTGVVESLDLPAANAVIQTESPSESGSSAASVKPDRQSNNSPAKAAPEAVGAKTKTVNAVKSKVNKSKKSI